MGGSNRIARVMLAVSLLYIFHIVDISFTVFATPEVTLAHDLSLVQYSVTKAEKRDTHLTISQEAVHF